MSSSNGGRAPAAPTDIGANGVSTLGRERVAEIQRARLVAAMVKVASEQGLSDASVARVVARAGVSRRTFYELFEDREECFLAAFDEGIARAASHLLEAYDPDAAWVERVRAGLIALLCFLETEPDMGRLLVVASLGAGMGPLQRRRHTIDRLVAVVDEGRVVAKAGVEPPSLTAEGLVGGALSIVHARLLASPPSDAKRRSRDRDADGESLLGLAAPLTSMIVLPYLGAAAARKEHDRPIPTTRSLVTPVAGDPLRDLDMRLTYRTVRVLTSVAAQPGSSNRAIGEASGLADQGQISKLLGRLERLGLVCNQGLAPGKGAPNAWALTEKGLEVEHAMSAGPGRVPERPKSRRR